MFVSCKSLLVRVETIQELENQYSGLYITKKEIDIGNNETLKKGTIIKLYFRSSKDFLIVYGYNYKKERESIIGKNILILVKDDFINTQKEQEQKEKKKKSKKKIFNKKILEKKLNDIIKPYKK